MGLQEVTSNYDFKANDKIRIESEIADGAFGRVYEFIFTPIIMMTPAPPGTGDGLTRVDCSATDLPRSRFLCTLPTQAAQSIVRYRVEYKMTGQVSGARAG